MVNKIKWTIAHEPADLFERTAEAFNGYLKDITGGEWEVETLKNHDLRGYSKLMAAVNDGTVDLAQIPVGRMGLHVLNWPYLFRDHAHATAVLEGDIGRNLLKSLKKKGMEGLAFTYSGGFRIFVSDDQVSSLADLRSVKLAVKDDEVTRQSLSTMGMTLDPRPVDEDSIYIEFPEDASGAETTYTRYLSHFSDKKFITHTEHSLFLTTVLARSTWFDSLDADLQSAIRKAALLAAADEREWSAQDTQKILGQAEDMGVTVYMPTEEENAELKASIENLDHIFPLERNIIKAIKSVA